MSLHLTYDEKERHRKFPWRTRFLTGVIFEVGGERFALIQWTGAVGSSSATEAAYGPLESFRQRIFFRRFRINSKG
jgi:hypothetical protein